MTPRESQKRAALRRAWRAGEGLDIKITDDALEVGLVEDGFFLGSTEKEGGAAEIVDPAGDALGVVVDEGEKAIGENRVVATGDVEMVLNVGGSLLEIEGFEVVADGDALAEGFKGSEAEHCAVRTVQCLWARSGWPRRTRVSKEAESISSLSKKRS